MLFDKKINVLDIYYFEVKHDEAAKKKENIKYEFSQNMALTPLFLMW